MSKAKKENFRKEQIRGTIKQLMRVRGLRSISISNYEHWKNKESNNNQWLHSLKLDLQDGYLYFYGYRDVVGDTRAGKRLKDLSMEQYSYASNQVENILNDESEIPSNLKRNILVKMAR